MFWRILIMNYYEVEFKVKIVQDYLEAPLCERALAKNKVECFFSSILKQKLFTDILERHYNERNSEGIPINSLTPFLDGEIIPY